MKFKSLSTKIASFSAHVFRNKSLTLSCRSLFFLLTVGRILHTVTVFATVLAVSISLLNASSISSMVFNSVDISRVPPTMMTFCTSTVSASLYRSSISARSDKVAPDL